MQAIVDRLPKDAVGKPVVPIPGDEHHPFRMWAVVDCEVCEVRDFGWCELGTWRGVVVGGRGLTRPSSLCYSTRAAAEDAREVQGG